MRCSRKLAWLCCSVLVLCACARNHRGGEDEEEEFDASSADSGSSPRDASASDAVATSTDTAPDADVPDCPGVLPSRAAGEAVYKAIAVDDRCNIHADCQIRTARVSCTAECPQAALSARGVMELAQRLSQIEREHCKLDAAQPVCPRAPVPQNCVDDIAMVARCEEGRCMSRQPGCGPGCEAEPFDGTCRGAALCDGCPAVVQDFAGLPCSEPERLCAPSGFCPPTIRCRDDDGDGSYVWVEETLLCSVDNP